MLHLISFNFFNKIKINKSLLNVDLLRKDWLKNIFLEAPNFNYILS